MRPLELMLVKRPELYPDLMGASEQDQDRLAEADRIRGLFVAPLPPTPDLAATFSELREAYRERKESLTNETADLEAVLAHEDRLSDRFAAIMEERQDELGERVVRAIRGTIDLRGIIRWSVIPYEETWPEAWWPQIGRLMNDSEWAFQYAPGKPTKTRASTPRNQRGWRTSRSDGPGNFDDSALLMTAVNPVTVEGKLTANRRMPWRP